MGSFRAWVVILLVLSGCAANDDWFEDGSERDSEGSRGDRSDLQGCVGEGFCSNAVAMLCEIQGQDPWSVCLTSPSGDRTAVVDVGANGTASVSPSGRWFRVLATGGYELHSSDGDVVRLNDDLGSYQWMPGDELIASAKDSLIVLDLEQNVIETIAFPPSVYIETVGFDISDDGDRLLFLGLPAAATGSLDRATKREIWLYERAGRRWSKVYSGSDFINLGSRPGFGPGDSTVIAQLSDSKVASGIVPLQYRIVEIDLDSRDLTTLEESEGMSAQYASVSPDGRLVAVRGESLVRVVNTETGKASKSIHVGPAYQTIAPSWSADSQLIGLDPVLIAQVRTGDEIIVDLPVDVSPLNATQVLSATFGEK